MWKRAGKEEGGGCEVERGRGVPVVWRAGRVPFDPFALQDLPDGTRDVRFGGRLPG
jgi:hypothetical protein